MKKHLNAVELEKLFNKVDNLVADKTKKKKIFGIWLQDELLEKNNIKTDLFKPTLKFKQESNLISSGISDLFS